MKKLMTSDSINNNEFTSVSFVAPQDCNYEYLATLDTNSSNIVVMHFNENISQQLTGKDQFTDHFIDKALQEITLMNLRKDVRKDNFDKDKVLKNLQTGKNTIIADRKKNKFEIFDYQPNVNKELGDLANHQALNNMVSNQSMMPIRKKQNMFQMVSTAQNQRLMRTKTMKKQSDTMMSET